MSTTELSNPFNTLLNLKFRIVTIMRPGDANHGTPVTIKVTPSNYSRNLSAPEETTIKGREFVISKKILDEIGFPAPKKGDRLKDPELGVDVISEVIPMFALGSEIVGFRVRTS